MRDSMDRYLLRIKSIRDQLNTAGEYIWENDVIIVTFAGLPKEYAIIRIVILARESAIFMKEFKALLLGAENHLSHNMSALYMQGSSSNSMSSQFQNGASSSNSSSVEFSSTGGRLTCFPLSTFGS